MTEEVLVAVDEKAEYRSYTKRKVFLILALLAGVIILLGLSLMIGDRDISFFEAYRLLFMKITGGEPVDTHEFLDLYIVAEVRLPMAVFAIIAGASLAVAGAAMQSVMNNPLADAYTTGISSGASLGVAVSMVLGISLVTNTSVAQFGTITNAFIFSLIPMMMILAVSSRMNTSPASLILAGIAVSYFLNAFTSLLMLVADGQTMQAVYNWQIGSISAIGWTEVPFMATVSIAGMIFMILCANKFNIMTMGESSAKALGLDIESFRLISMIIISLMVASVISFTGIIGFVGLVCPHMIRSVIHSDNRYVMPASAMLGAVMMLSCQLVTVAISPDTLSIPVGVILSFVGAPIFLYLIVRRNSNVW
ncbi:ABC-type Fe3+-siderophore transport system, permease component [Thermoplasmatales archaeon BRNA1]|nr:ABC-type Fe3+-siderophore transport system, permease component [Thermoplasmatales archaeon BRNA1]